MSHTRSECICRTPELTQSIMRIFGDRRREFLRTIDQYVTVGSWIREGRLTRRFTDFPLDAYDLA